MAKKKRKHRTPKAPPVHSAPASQQPLRPAAGPAGTPPPGGGTEAVEAPGSGGTRRTKDIVAARQAARRKKGRRRTILVAGGVVLLLVGAIVVQQLLSARSLAAFNEVMTAGGCSELQTFGGLGTRHIDPGEQVNYDPMPPVGGDHAAATIPAGVYDAPFSTNPADDANIYRAVHSLEHGYVLVWHNGLEEDEQLELENASRGERKVIVVPFPDLEEPTRMSLTAWGHKVDCRDPSTEVVNAFIDRLREASSAPEAHAP